MNTQEYEENKRRIRTEHRVVSGEYSLNSHEIILKSKNEICTNPSWHYYPKNRYLKYYCSKSQ